MIQYNKHTYILFLAFIFISIEIKSQEVKVIDNKGTITTVNNNTVISSNSTPTNPLEGDVWFDTSNSEIKFYDADALPLAIWRSLSDNYGKNIYNTDGTLTSNRLLTGDNYTLRYTGLDNFYIDNTNYIDIKSNNLYFATTANTSLNADRLFITSTNDANINADRLFITSTNDASINADVLFITTTASTSLNADRLFITSANDASINSNQFYVTTNFGRFTSTGSLELNAAVQVIFDTPTTFMTEDIAVGGGYRDSTNDFGAVGQVLSSQPIGINNGTKWVNPTTNTITKSSTTTQNTPATYTFPVSYTPIESDFFIYSLASGDHNIIYIYNGTTWDKITPTKASSIFYPPSIAIDASTITTGSIDLYATYFAQFNSPIITSDVTAPSIPTYNADELYYYVTYADPTVFGNGTIVNNMSISATGILNYEIFTPATDDNTIINIVFVVK